MLNCAINLNQLLCMCAPFIIIIIIITLAAIPAYFVFSLLFFFLSLVYIFSVLIFYFVLHFVVVAIVWEGGDNCYHSYLFFPPCTLISLYGLILIFFFKKKTFSVLSCSVSFLVFIPFMHSYTREWNRQLCE